MCSVIISLLALPPDYGECSGIRFSEKSIAIEY
jgi:hypothetical protein